MDDPRSRDIQPTWARSGRFLPRTLVRPIQEFLRASTAGGVVLVLAAVAALVWANAGGSYERVWQTSLAVTAGDFQLEGDLRYWVSEGLMSLFFLVAGLEIKRELLIGELRRPRAAMLPVVAALAGMVVPAVLYLAFVNGPGRAVWGAVMPTDVALTLGVLALAGRFVPRGLFTLLMAVALVDDVATIAALAIFYSTEISSGGLAVAALAVLAIVVAERVHVRASIVYMCLGVILWLGLETGGVHPALAGAVMGFLTPVSPFQRPAAVSAEAKSTADATSDDPATLDEDLPRWLHLAALSREAVAPLARIEHALLPLTSYVVLPLFVLANAGVVLTGSALTLALGEPLVPALVLTRLGGKVIGIVGVSYLVVRSGFAALPDGVGWWHLVGGAAATAIAFTVSLFVVDIAFPGAPQLVAASKIAIIASGIVSGSVAVVILRLASRGRVGSTTSR